MKYDYVVVGAGFTGATVAEQLTRYGKKVLVVDERPRVGGTSADTIDEFGNLSPLFGPHAFHTNSDVVMNYLEQFEHWKPYVQRSLSFYNGDLFEIPINANTIEKFFEVEFESDDDCRSFMDSQIELPKSGKITTSKELALATMGRDLYEAFFETYTIKQWACGADDLHRSVIGRLPMRYDRDDRYFTDKYQVLPHFGFTTLITHMLQGIEVYLGNQISLAKALEKGNEVIWTGPIDLAFELKFGNLEWRSLRWEYSQSLVAMEAAVIHEPGLDVSYMRALDSGYFYSSQSNNGQRTWIREFSIGMDHPNADPFYPILRPNGSKVLDAYLEEAKLHERVHFLGRMGRFKYINMDQAVADALSWIRHHTGCIRMRIDML